MSEPRGEGPLGLNAATFPQTMEFKWKKQGLLVWELFSPDAENTEQPLEHEKRSIKASKIQQIFNF